MALPRDRLSVWICPTGTPADPDPGTGFPDLWEDITSYVRYREAITITVGRPDEADEVDPSDLSLNLDNSDGRFSPRNPMGAYFPDLAMNTPITVAWDVDGLGTLVSLYTGFVTEWPPRWDLTGIDAVVPLRANGVLRRLSQGQPSLKSAIYREIVKSSRPDPVQYWTCQDPSGGLELSSAIPGLPAMKIVGTPNLAAYDGWAASDPLPTMNLARHVGPVPGYTPTGEILIRVFYDIPAGAENGTQILGFPSTGSASRWAVTYETASGGTLRLIVSDDDGVELVNQNVGFAVTGSKFSFSLEITRVNPDLDWLMLVVKINDDGTTTAAQFDGTVTNRTLGQIKNVVINYNRVGDTIAFGHIVFSTDQSIFDDTADALVGWVGELAGDRILRLSEEEEVFVNVLGAASAEMEMGPQRPKTFLELIRECVHADGGVLYEEPDSFGLTYRNRADLYNQEPPGMVLLVLSAPPEPIDDDQQMVNDVTVTRDHGSSARASDHDHIVKFGRYETSVQLNLAANASAGDVASWLVHLGTIDEMRWPRINFDPAPRHSELIDPWLALRTQLASRLVIDHAIAQLPGIDINVLVQGWTERLDGDTWRVELNCSPASPWNVAEVAFTNQPDHLYNRVDTDGSTLAAPVAASTLHVEDFEGDTSHWSGTGGTFARTTLLVHDGTAGGSLVADGVTPVPFAQTTIDGSPTVVASTAYTLTAWLQRIPGTTPLSIAIVWRDAGGAVISTSASSILDPLSGLWQQFALNATAPAAAVKAQLRVRMHDTPNAGDTLWFDDLRLSSETALTVSSGSNPPWTTATAEFPFDVVIGGEAMTVVSVTGATSPQTFAVGRAANGVIKSHVFGDDVRLAYPAIVAL